MDDKKVRIGFEVNAKGLNDAREAIRALTRDITKLSEVASRVNLGGLMGGVSSKSGPINARQEAIKLPGISSSLGAGIAKDAQALGQVAKAGIGAMDGMTRGLKANFTSQIQDIQRLEKELVKLEGAYSKLKTLRATTMDAQTSTRARSTMDAYGNRMESLEADIRGRRAEAASGAFSKAQRWASGSQTADDKREYEAEHGGGKSGGGGRGFFGGALQASGATGALRVLGSPAMIGAAAVYAVKAAIDSNTSRTTANAAERLGLGMEQGRLGARIGNSMGSMGMAIRGGDLALSRAYSAVRGQMGDRNDLTWERRRMAKAGVGDVGSGEVSNAISEVGARAVEAVAGDERSAKDRSSVGIALARDRRQRRAEITEEQVEMAQNRVAARAKDSMFERQTYGDAFGNISLARTGGLSLGLNKVGKAASFLGLPEAQAAFLGANTKLGEFNAKALNHGYQPGEIAGARATLGGIAGRGLMGGGETMLSAQYGGFSNAGNIMGIGAQYGSKPMGLFNTAQLGMGRGGVDATAGSQISGLVASLMGSGNFMGSDGNALMMGMMSAGRTGSTGGDMLRANQLQGGVGVYGSLLGGKTDRLQEGINMLAAQGSGASGWYAKKSLMGMGVGEMTAALRSGKVSASLADQGVDIGMVRRYKASQDSYGFSRYMDGEGAGTATGRSVAGVRGAGSINAYLRGFKGKDRDAEVRRLAGALSQTNGGTLNEQMGSIYAGMASDKVLAPDLKGKGAWAASIKGTVEEAGAKNQAKAAEEYSKWQAAQYDSLKKDIGDIDANQKEIALITKALAGDAKEFSSAVGQMSQAMMDALMIIAPARAAELQAQGKEFREMMKHKAEAKGAKWLKDNNLAPGSASNPAGHPATPKMPHAVR